MEKDVDRKMNSFIEFKLTKHKAYCTLTNNHGLFQLILLFYYLILTVNLWPLIRGSPLIQHLPLIDHIVHGSSNVMLIEAYEVEWFYPLQIDYWKEVN